MRAPNSSYRQQRHAAVAPYLRRVMGLAPRGRGPVRRTVRRRAPVRRSKVNVRRAPSADALFYAQRLDPFKSSGHGLSDGSGTRTAVFKSRMIVPCVSSQPTAERPSELRVRVMPCVGTSFSDVMYKDEVGPVEYWADHGQFTRVWGKVQVANQFVSDALPQATDHAAFVFNRDDEIFPTAQATWDSYRPVAMGLRVTNTTPQDDRGGTLYLAHTHFRDPTSGQGTMLNQEMANNNFRIGLGVAATAVGAARYGLVTHHNFAPFAQVTGNEGVVVLDASRGDLPEHILHWTPTGNNDTHFANYTARGSAHQFESPTAAWTQWQKYFQEGGLDMLYVGPRSQSFQVEIMTIYEVILDRSVEEMHQRQVPRANAEAVAQVAQRVAPHRQPQGLDGARLARELIGLGVDPVQAAVNAVRNRAYRMVDALDLAGGPRRSPRLNRL